MPALLGAHRIPDTLRPRALARPTLTPFFFKESRIQGTSNNWAESAAALDVAVRLEVATAAQCQAGRETFIRIVSMLTNMVRAPC